MGNGGWCSPDADPSVGQEIEIRDPTRLNLIERDVSERTVKWRETHIDTVFAHFHCETDEIEEDGDSYDDHQP